MIVGLQTLKSRVPCAVFQRIKERLGLYCTVTMGLSMFTTRKDIWSSSAFPEAEKADIVLLHENEKGIYGDTDLRCLDLMENLGCDHFRAVFDFANFIQCGVETVPAYQRLKPYVDYIHIKDAVAETGTVVPPGMGDGHLAEILTGFKADGYTGFLSLEPHLTNFTGLSGLEKDADHRDTVLTGEQAFTLAHDSLIDILKKI